MTAKHYQPKGTILPFLAAVSDDPYRVFSVPDAARIMDIPTRAVTATLAYAIKNGVIYRGKDSGGCVLYRGSPFSGQAPVAKPASAAKPRKLSASGWPTTADDIRVPRVVPGWTPPKMVCARLA